MGPETTLQSVCLPLSYRIKTVCLSGTSSSKWASGQSAACRADTTVQLWSHALFTAESEVTADRVCGDDTVTFSSTAASCLKRHTLCCSYCSFIHTGGCLSHLGAVSRASYTGVCTSFTFHQKMTSGFRLSKQFQWNECNPFLCGKTFDAVLFSNYRWLDIRLYNKRQLWKKIDKQWKVLVVIFLEL